MEEGYKTTTIQVPYSLHNLARDNFIELKGALGFGIKFLLAEKDKGDYPNCDLLRDIMQLQDKIQKVVSRLEAISKENFILKDKLKELGYDYDIKIVETPETTPIQATIEDLDNALNARVEEVKDE
jgi:hypothetical protein